MLKLFDDDEFIDWLLTQIFDGFKIDVSYMTDEEYATCMSDTFNKLDYRNIPESKLTGEKWMEKSVNIGDQLSQVIGIYYPYRIDNYVKYVRSQKFYGRYMDDWYIMNDIIVKLGKVSEQYPSFISIQPIVFTEMNFEPVPLMRDTSSFNRSTIVIDNMLLHFRKQDFIA